MFLKKRTPTISWLDPQCHRLKHPNIAWVCPDTGYTGIPQVITIEPWETWCCNPWHGMGYSTLAKSCLRQPSIEPFWNRNCKNGERTQGHGNRTQKGVPFSNLQAAQDFVEEGETETEASRAACNQLGIRASLPIPFLLARAILFPPNHSILGGCIFPWYFHIPSKDMAVAMIHQRTFEIWQFFGWTTFGWSNIGDPVPLTRESEPCYRDGMIPMIPQHRGQHPCSLLFTTKRLVVVVKVYVSLRWSQTYRFIPFCGVLTNLYMVL